MMGFLKYLEDKKKCLYILKIMTTVTFLCKNKITYPVTENKTTRTRLKLNYANNIIITEKQGTSMFY